MKLNVALIAANGVTYPKPRIGMLTSPTYSDDGRITSALFEEEPVMNPVFRTARRADEEDVPAPLMAVEHYDLGVFVDWVWDCNQERLALRAKVKELEAKVSTEAEVPTGDVIYLYRRIGLGRDEWATCDKERFLLLSDNKQFETKYAWPAGTVGMLQACLKESEAENSNLRLQCGGMQGDIVDLRADLVEAASVLRRYETYHRDKGTEESIRKAEVNAALATRFELTLGRYGDAPA